MKKVAILLSLAVLFALSCTKSDLESTQQVSNVSATPCKQGILKSSRLSDKSDKVDVEFTNKGVEITHYNFEVTCDFTTVNVTHTLVNGVLRITQQGSPNQADCVCHSDVSYTIDGISQNEVNVIFINGIQVYCHNGNSQSDCDPNVIIDEEEYFNVPEFRGHISNLKIEGNNLKFTITASGCSRNSWVAKLITTGAIAKSLPPQRTVQISFENSEMCAAVFSREFSFNIECLRVEGYNKVQLNIAGNWILYEYGNNDSNCDRDVIVSQTEYENAPDRSVFIEDMKIISNCLKISYTTTVCDSRVWNLVDLGSVAESLPCQRYLRFSIAYQSNIECHAAMPDTREMSFNIESLQIQGNKSVILHILDKTILYEY